MKNVLISATLSATLGLSAFSSLAQDVDLRMSWWGGNGRHQVTLMSSLQKWDVVVSHSVALNRQIVVADIFAPLMVVVPQPCDQGITRYIEQGT